MPCTYYSWISHTSHEHTSHEERISNLLFPTISAQIWLSAFICNSAKLVFLRSGKFSHGIPLLNCSIALPALLLESFACVCHLRNVGGTDSCHIPRDRCWMCPCMTTVQTVSLIWESHYWLCNIFSAVRLRRLVQIIIWTVDTGPWRSISVDLTVTVGGLSLPGCLLPAPPAYRLLLWQQSSSSVQAQQYTRPQWLPIVRVCICVTQCCVTQCSGTAAKRFSALAPTVNIVVAPGCNVLCRRAAASCRGDCHSGHPGAQAAACARLPAEARPGGHHRGSSRRPGLNWPRHISRLLGQNDGHCRGCNHYV